MTPVALSDAFLIASAVAAALLLALLVLLIARRRRQRIVIDAEGRSGPTLARVRPAAADADPAPLAEASALLAIKGLGPRAAGRLEAAGIASIAQLAALDEAAAAALDASLGDLAGRLARDQWVAQAKLLAAGDTAGYETRFGKLGGGT